MSRQVKRRPDVARLVRLTLVRLTVVADLTFAASFAVGQTGGRTQSDSQNSISTQLWANVVLEYPKGKSSLFELDIEPKAQTSEGDKWRSLDLTPLVEYYPARWLDLEAELAVGRTHQFEGVNTWEVTPRLGFRLNILSSLREEREAPLANVFGRVRLSTLVRFEYRNFYYSDSTPASHQWRFRARLESKVGINHVDLSLDRTLYGIADLEGFVPLGGEVSERFASKVRARVGLGYRFGYQCRLEVLYIRDSHRATKESPFGTDANILDVKVKLFF